MMCQIDLNCDLGEGYGPYSFGQDEEIISLISSANIACGYHAGDPQQMFKTVKMCLEHQVAIGAHPGYPDLAGFGRRSMGLSYEEIRGSIIYQVGGLMAIAGCLGGQVVHIKPHGALYHAALNNRSTAAAIIEAVALLKGPALMIMAGTKIVDWARESGLRVIEEGFADRNYQTRGALVGRQDPQAVITDPREAAARVLRMVTEHQVDCVGGEAARVTVDTVCIHSDHPQAVNMLTEIRRELGRHKVRITPAI